MIYSLLGGLDCPLPDDISDALTKIEKKVYMMHKN